MASGNILSSLNKKLVGVENYGSWKYQMKTLLVMNDLRAHLDGKVVRQALDAITQTKFDAKSRFALGLINMLISGNLIEDVKDTTIFKNAQDAITSHFETKNNAKNSMLRNQLYNLKLIGSMVDHMQQVKAIKNQLSAIGEIVTNKEKITSICKSLSKLYENFLTSLIIFNKLNIITFNDLEGWLVQCKQSLEDNDGGESSSSFATKFNEKKPFVLKKNNTPTEQNVYKEGLQGPKKTKMFYYYGKHGHIKKNYRKLQFSQQKQNDQQNQQMKKQQFGHSFGHSLDRNEKGKKLFVVAYQTSYNSNDAWYSDLGASRHMIGKLGWFKHMWELTRQIVALGEGTILKVGGIRESSIITPIVEDCHIDDALHILGLKKKSILLVKLRGIQWLIILNMVNVLLKIVKENQQLQV